MNKQEALQKIEELKQFIAKEDKSEERQFGKLICRPIEQMGVSFDEIVVPEGWRVPTVQEGIELINDEDFVEWSKFSDQKHDFYVQQPFNRYKNRAAWFGCNGSYFFLGAYDYLGSASATRGVLFVKEGEK